jgi:V/A-type H+-transporting ATPase subunit D
MIDVAPTHSAFLELMAERDAMDEGYRFLDEKRLILASEILAELGRYGRVMAEFLAAYDQAREHLRTAIERHGLDGVLVYPAAEPLAGDLRVVTRSILGVEVQSLEYVPPPLTAPEDSGRSPEGDACRAAFRALIPALAQLAVGLGNLERLRRDYVRTARRARALEDVLLPEVQEALEVVDAVLEEQDREEAIRVRRTATAS